MSKTPEEFLSKIELIHNIISTADKKNLKNEDWLTTIISMAGLYNEGDRRHPQNTNIHLYGDDVKYMNIIPNAGMWQIPRQLAQFLITLSSLGNIKSFLDIGTCRGCTITIIAIYMLRFGIEYIDTIDVIKWCDDSMVDLWKKLHLPINYIIIPSDDNFSRHVSRTQYSVIFIDGNHEYKYVLNDYNIAKSMTNIICFHDINDCFCVDVVRLWQEIKHKREAKMFYEFTYHSHGYNLMGIGMLERQ
jgi:hypothetical protein